MTLYGKNLVITMAILGAVVYLAATGSKDVALALIPAVLLLWRRSGRKSDGGALLLMLALASCDGNTFLSVNKGQAALVPVAPTGFLTDYIELKPGSSPTVTSNRAAIYALSSDNLLYTTDAAGLTLKLHAAQSLRTSASCAGLAAPAAGDVCYDTTLSAPRYYAGGWSTVPADSSVVHLAGSETITSAKTFNAAPVFAAGLTTSGSTANNFGGSSGDFTLSTGNVAWTGAAGKGVTLTQGAGATGSPVLLALAGGAHTGLTASTEAPDIYANLARTVTFATGALTAQRAFRIAAPTYAFAGASTITDAATVAISAAPTAGSNATITNAHALLVEAGRTTLKGALTVTGGASSIVTSSAALTLTAGAASTWSTSSGALTIDSAAALNLGTTSATGVAVGRSGQTTSLLGAVQINSAPVVANFFKTCTITSAAAATPVNCLSAADVPAALSAKLGTWHAYVNGGTGWGTTATCVIEDTAGNDLITIAVAAMTSNTFIDDASGNVTKEARYRLGTGGAADAGLQISCNANGTGSDLVVVMSGVVQ